MPRKSANKDLGQITVTNIPKTLIKKLNKIARNRIGVSRNAYLKSCFFEIVRVHEEKDK